MLGPGALALLSGNTLSYWFDRRLGLVEGIRQLGMAAHLQRDLRRAGIVPFGWVINQSLHQLDGRDPVFVSRQRHEGQFLREVATEHASRVGPVPWQVMAPIGVEGLRAVISPRAEEALAKE